ncbi:IS66 family transposase [Sphingomonas sp. 37zxx]|uniref:IS66 family transposase n=1 Tax=Sphingomonas sp. 37zxx TaxID=1550073 RepID=UPI0009DD5FA5
MDDGEQDILGAAVAQLVHHPQPELRTLILLEPQAEDLLGQRLLSYICEAPKIHGDETPVTVLRGEDGSRTAYFWVYLRDGGSSGDITPPAVVFRFTQGRGGEHPAAHLAGYRGYLQADGYKRGT